MTDYDLVVEMDSDLSHRPEELPGLLAAARAHDLTIGEPVHARRIGDGLVGLDGWRSPRAGNRYARLMLGLPVHDATSGFRVLPAPRCWPSWSREPIRSDGYGFQIELVDRANRMRLRRRRIADRVQRA